MDKEKQYYEISDAFLALKDIDDDEIEGMLRNERKLREGKAFSIQTGSKDLEAARNFIDEEAETDEEIEVIDVDADSVAHLKKNAEYIGQGILCCNRCKANRFIDMDLLVASDSDEEVFNIDDECPHCHDAGSGYSLIGQVGKVQKESEPTAETEEVFKAEIENDAKSEDEATFENDVEPETEEASEEETVEEPEENPEVDTLPDEPEETDGMETDTSEDELEDLDLPSLGDEIDQDNVKQDEEDDDAVKESLNEKVQLNALAEEAWMMNKVISAMNNEDAYYGSWLYIWPDGESREECAYDFGDQESFDELEETFLDTYKRYHADGLYDADLDVVEYAHKIDSKLSLAKIENLAPIKRDMRESFDCSVVGDIFKGIISPEKLNKIIVFDVSDEECEPRAVFKGTQEELPLNIVGSPCKSFDVADGYLSCNIDSDIKNTNRPLSKALECFNDEDTEKVLIWDQATGDEVFSGTKAEACDRFGQCEFISFETPAVIRICINNPSILSCDEVEETAVETDVDKLVKKIIDANNLSQYKTDKPNTNEYWINACLQTNDDVELIYESFVKPLEDKKLIKEFKTITGYNNPLEEAYEAGVDAAKKAAVQEDVTLDKVKAEVTAAETLPEDPGTEEQSTDTNNTSTKQSSVQSFKSRKELAAAVSECKNNSRPYMIRRSQTEGFRYDLITEDIEDTQALVSVDNNAEAADVIQQGYPVGYSKAELAFMNNLQRVASDIADAIKRYYDIDADPALIIADILQDLKLISGQVSPEDLSDTLINQATKEMFRSYNQFYTFVDELISEMTGETIQTTPQQKLAQAIRALHGPAFKTANIDRAIGSTAFVKAIRAGQVPYIAANDIPLLAEELEKDENITKEDILAWIAEHEQAAEDFVKYFDGAYFNVDDELVADNVDVEEIKVWINEHEQLATDFYQFFGVKESVETNDCDECVCEKCGKSPCECTKEENLTEDVNTNYVEYSPEKDYDFLKECYIDWIKTWTDYGENYFNHLDSDEEIEKRFNESIKKIEKILISKPGLTDIQVFHGPSSKVKGVKAGKIVIYFKNNDIYIIEGIEDLGLYSMIDDAELKAIGYKVDPNSFDLNHFFGVNTDSTLDNESLDVDTEFFDKEMNEYFNEAYEDTIIYTTTGGQVNEDGTIVLKGLLQLDENFSNVEFTLTPEKTLVENLGNKVALNEVLNQKFTVTNNISEERFEFEFNKAK